jgi:hypothetical protein
VHYDVNGMPHHYQLEFYQQSGNKTILQKSSGERTHSIGTKEQSKN